MPDKTVMKILGPSAEAKISVSKMDEEQLQREYDYYQAQKILEEMRRLELISVDEFNKITALNRKKFCPYLVEIMPNIT